MKDLLIIDLPEDLQELQDFVKSLPSIDTYYDNLANIKRLSENCYGIYYNTNYNEWLGAFKNTETEYYTSRFNLKIEKYENIKKEANAKTNK